jgi:hypothetical protein
MGLNITYQDRGGHLDSQRILMNGVEVEVIIVLWKCLQSILCIMSKVGGAIVWRGLKDLDESGK